MPKKHKSGGMSKQDRSLRVQRIVIVIIGVIVILSMLASLMTTY